MCHQNCHRHLLSTPDETLHAQRNALRCSSALATSRRDIGAAAAATPLCHNARQNARRCCHLTPGTSALQTPLRRCVSTRQNARRCSCACGAAISPRGHRLRRFFSSETPPELQPRVRHYHLTPGDIGAAAAAMPLHLYAQRHARRCSRARVAVTNA